jgi:cytochrome P450
MQETTVERLGAEYLRDPYSVCRRLREEAPVRQVVLPAGLKVWLVTRYADVRAALADHRLGKDAGRMSDLFDVHLTGDRSRDREGAACWRRTCSTATRRTTNACAAW